MHFLTMRFFTPLLVLLGCLTLYGCGTETTTPDEALDIKVDTLEPAYIGEDYSTTLRAVGGLTPYQYRLDRGTLPPGMSLQGGEIRGTPTEKGEFTFTITVSDANLSKTFEEYTLSVTDAPPAQLTLNVPDTQIQRPVTLRGDIKEARGLQGFRTLITWDPERFALVEGRTRPNNDAFLLFTDGAEGQLRVDVGFKAGVLTGDRRVFEFTLQPLERTNPDGTPAPASTLFLESKTEFIGENNTHAYIPLTEGVAPSDTPPTNENADPTLDSNNDGIPDVEDTNNNGTRDNEEDLDGNGTPDGQETSGTDTGEGTTDDGTTDDGTTNNGEGEQ
ncbi:MAG: Ig domain-containing protein [Trueperaceae bacterium]